MIPSTPDDCGRELGRVEHEAAGVPSSRTGHDRESGESTADSVQTAPGISASRKRLCLVGSLAVVVSAFCFAPSDPLANGVMSGVALLHMFAVTLFLSLALLSNRGSNVVTNHGGVGLLAGLGIGLVFEAQLKAGGIFFLFGALPGVVFGVVIGMIRSAATLDHASRCGSDRSRDQHCSESSDRPTSFASSRGGWNGDGGLGGIWRSCRLISGVQIVA